MAIIPNLTFDDFQQFLKEIAPKGNVCSVCGSTEWTIMYIHENEDRGAVAALYGLGLMDSLDSNKPTPLTNPLGPMSVAGSPVLPTSCNNCGNLRLFRATRIADWHKNRTEKQDGTSEA